MDLRPVLIGCVASLFVVTPAHAVTTLPQSTAQRADVTVRVPLQIERLPPPHELRVYCDVIAPAAREPMPQAYRIERPLPMPAEGTLRDVLEFHFDLPDGTPAIVDARCAAMTSQGRALCSPDGPYLSALAPGGLCTDTATAAVEESAAESERELPPPPTPVLGTPVEAPIGTVLTAPAPVTQYGLLGEAHADPNPRPYRLDLKRMTIHNVTTALDDNYETGGDEPWVMVIRLQGRLGDPVNPGTLLFLDDRGWGKVGPDNWGVKGASRSLTARWAKQLFDGVRPYEFAGAMLVVLEADGMPNAERQAMFTTIGESVQAAWSQALRLRVDLDYRNTTPTHAKAVVTRLAEVMAPVEANLRRAVADGTKAYLTRVMQRAGTPGFVPFVPDQVMDAKLVMTLNPAGLPASTIEQVFTGAVVPAGSTWRIAKFSIEAEQVRNANDGFMSPMPEKGAHWSIDHTLEEAATP